MKDNTHDMPLHDDQDPSILTGAGIVLEDLQRRHRRAVERAVLAHLMDHYQARAAMLMCSHDAVEEAAKAREHLKAAEALLDSAEGAGVECRPRLLEDLAKIARRSLRGIHRRSLGRLEDIHQRSPSNEPGGGPGILELRRDIWKAQAMLHMLDEPPLPG